ncbi:MAG: dephospho-CoA kinase [Bacillota bacterium]
MKIGLTGGIASGKSTVTGILDSLGAKIIDADKIAHQLMKPEKKLWTRIVDSFGEEILQSNGTIDRNKLGTIIFNNRQEKEKLDQISHPIIISEIKSQLKKMTPTEEIIVVDIPLLVEADLMDLFQEVWLVYITKEQQINRLMERSQIDREAALARIESQMPLSDKKKYADRIIDNNGSISQLEQRVKKLWEEIK